MYPFCSLCLCGKKLLIYDSFFMENCTAGRINLSCQLFNFYVFVLHRVELFSLNTQVLFWLGLFYWFFVGSFCGGDGLGDVGCLCWAFVLFWGCLLALVMIPLWKSPVQNYLFKAMKNIFKKRSWNKYVRSCLNPNKYPSVEPTVSPL